MEHIYQQQQFGEDWFTYAGFYTEMVNRFPSGSKFVEVGSWKGKSASYMCVEIINSQKNIEFYCVDHFLGSSEHQTIAELPQLYDTFIANMSSLEGHYNTLKMPSADAASTFEDESLDFVFIDAAHEYENVKSDINAWLPKVKVGGILAGHDYFHGPVKQAVEDSNLTDIRVDYDSWIYEVK